MTETRPELSRPPSLRGTDTEKKTHRGRSWLHRPFVDERSGWALGAGTIFVFIALFFGLRWLGPTVIGFTWHGAVRGLTGQLGTTVPAAVLMALSAAANLVAGAVLMRLLRAEPFESWGEAVVLGFCGSVLWGFTLLAVLGRPGLFSFPLVALAHAAVLAVGFFRARPLVVSKGFPRPHLPPVAWVLIALLWGSPVLIQLVSPIVPFADIIPNHIAPVEHVRSFHSFATLTTSPGAPVGPSRILLGYVGLLAAVATLAGQSAAKANAAYILPLTLVMGVAVYRFGRAALGPLAAALALVTVTISFTFLRLPDVRGTVIVFPLVLAALTPHRARTPLRHALVGAAALGAAMTVHPNIAAMGVLALVGGAIGSDDSRPALAAAAGAAGIAVPQGLTMLGLDAPSYVGLVAFPSALAAAWVAIKVRLPLTLIAKVAAVVAAVAALRSARLFVERADGFVGNMSKSFPLLVMGFAGAVFVRKARSPAVMVPILAGAAAGVAASFGPSTSPGLQLTFSEVVWKAHAYWVPFFLAFAVAGALAWVAVAKNGWTLVAAVAFLVVASLPLRPITVGIDSIEEHRMSEVLSVALHRAQYGAWERYPHHRNLVDRPRARLVEFFRELHRRGDVTKDTKILHVASSWQVWIATPLAAFTGVHETQFSPDPDRSNIAFDGRLYELKEFDRFLGPPYAYVVVEPRGSFPEFRTKITTAGYERIFSNRQAEVFSL